MELHPPLSEEAIATVLGDRSFRRLPHVAGMPEMLVFERSVPAEPEIASSSPEAHA
jgi:hypothetical protein